MKLLIEIHNNTQYYRYFIFQEHIGYVSVFYIITLKPHCDNFSAK